MSFFSIHRLLDHLFKVLFRLTTKKSSKFHITDPLCWSPMDSMHKGSVMWKLLACHDITIHCHPYIFLNCSHYNDVIMGMIASKITSLMIVYSTVYSDPDQRKHQNSPSLAFVQGNSLVPISIWWRHHVYKSQHTSKMRANLRYHIYHDYSLF